MRVTHVLLATRLFFLSSTVLMYLIAYGNYWTSPANPGISRSVRLSFIISSRQVVSGTSFLVAACVAYIVAQRRKADPMIRQLHSMVISCERFMEEIADFRVESEDIRMESKFDNSNTMAAKLQQVRSRKAAVKVRRRRRRKRKDEEEGPPDALKAWGASPDMMAGSPDWHGMIRGIETSFQKLPPLPDSFQRPGGAAFGGERNWKHEHRLGGGVDLETRHVRIPPPPVPPPDGATGALEQGNTLPPLELCPPVPPPALPPDGALFAEGVTPDQTQIDLTIGSMGLTPPVLPESGWAADPTGLRNAGEASGDVVPPAGLREAGEAHASAREGPPVALETPPAQPILAKPGPSLFLPDDASGIGHFEPSASGLLGAMHASFSVGASLPEHLRAPIPPSSSSFSGAGEFTAGQSATDAGASAAAFVATTAAGSTISDTAAASGDGHGVVGELSSIRAEALLEPVNEFGVPGLSDAELSSDAAQESQARPAPQSPVNRKSGQAIHSGGNVCSHEAHPDTFPPEDVAHPPGAQQGDNAVEGNASANEAQSGHPSADATEDTTVPLPPVPNIHGNNLFADGRLASTDVGGNPTVPLPPAPNLQDDSVGIDTEPASADAPWNPAISLPPGPNLQGDAVGVNGGLAENATVPPMPPLPGTPRADDGSGW